MQAISWITSSLLLLLSQLLLHAYLIEKIHYANAISILPSPYLYSSILRPPLFAPELLALRELYDQCHGPEWLWIDGAGTPWNFTEAANDPSSPCFNNWQGIECTCNRTVPVDNPFQDSPTNYPYYYDDTLQFPNTGVCSIWKLALIQRNLKGKLPTAALSSFRNLTHLHLALNKLTGSLTPQLFSSMTMLRALDVSANRLTGNIPTTIGLLKHLGILSAHSNSLTGSIPTEIFHHNMKNLSLIYLGDNSFSSSIPESICALSASITGIYMEYSSLTGPLPSCLGSFSLLQALSMAGNRFTGTIPSSFSNLQSLNLLDLSSGNMFTGPFPQFVFQLPSMWHLLLSGNPFDPWRFSDSIQNLRNLSDINLQSTNLYGTLPSALGELTQLQYIYLSENLLSSTIHGSLSQLSNLVVLFLSMNHFVGSLPEALCGMTQLKILNVMHNSLTSTIPSIIAQASSLEFLLLAYNSFSGSLPTQFNALTQQQLQIMDLSHNQLTSTLPPTIFLLPQLQIFAASVNCIVGKLPSTVCEATNMQELILDGLNTAAACRAPVFFAIGNAYDPITFPIANTNIGLLPPCPNQLPALEVLHMSGNAISGSLPQAMVLSPNLRELSFSHNRLTGHIPQGIQLHKNWQILDLSFNKLGGVLDSNFPILNNASVLLAVNRISGGIPRSLITLSSIDILDGNLFRCDIVGEIFSSNTLPDNDPAASHYQCGSNIVYALLTLWVIVGAIATLMALYKVIKRSRQRDIESRKQTADAAAVAAAAVVGVDAWNPSNQNRSMTMLKLSDDNSTSTQIGQNSIIRPSVSPGSEAARYGSTSTLNSTSLRPSKGFNENQLNNFAAENPLNASARSSSRNQSLEGLSWENGLSSAWRLTSVLSGIRTTVAESLLLAEGHSDNTYGTRGNEDQQRPQTLLDVADCLKRLRRSCVVVVIILVCFLLPVFSALDRYFKMFEMQYIWAASVAFLSGQAAGTTLVVIFIVLLIAFDIILHHPTLFTKQSSLRSFTSTLATEEKSSPAVSIPCLTKLKNYSRLAVVLLTNSVIVVIVNAVYIVATYTLNGFQALVVSIWLSIFKMIWTRFMVPWIVALIIPDSWERALEDVDDGNVIDEEDMTRRRKSMARAVQYQRLQSLRSTQLQCIVTIINIIIMPMVSTGIISPNCLKYVFIQPPEVTTSYTYQVCDHYSAFDGSCAFYLTNVQEISYLVPWIYSYECASMVLVSYLPVFISMLTISSFILPAITAIILSLQTRLQPGSFWSDLLIDVLPVPLRPLNKSDELLMLARFKRFASRFSISRLSIGNITALSSAPNGGTADKDGVSVDDNSQKQQPTREITSNPILENSLPSASVIDHPETNTTNNNTADTRTSEHSVISEDSNRGDSSEVDDTTGSHNGNVSNRPERKVFRKDVFCSGIIQTLSVMFTFGIAFPPLAVLALISLYSQTYSTQVFLSRFYHAAKQSNMIEYMNRIDRHCEGLEVHLSRSLVFLIPLSAVFMSGYVFDIIGDEVGSLGATWAPCCLIGVVFLGRMVISYFPRLRELVTGCLKTQPLVRPPTSRITSSDLL